MGRRNRCNVHEARARDGTCHPQNGALCTSICPVRCRPASANDLAGTMIFACLCIVRERVHPPNGPCLAKQSPVVRRRQQEANPSLVPSSWSEYVSLEGLHRLCGVAPATPHLSPMLYCSASRDAVCVAGVDNTTTGPCPHYSGWTNCL